MKPEIETACDKAMDANLNIENISFLLQRFDFRDCDFENPEDFRNRINRIGKTLEKFTEEIFEHISKIEELTEPK